MWVKLASHLHKGLQEVKSQTSSTDFLLWMEYLKLKQKEDRREDYYAAQIAAEIRRSSVKKPARVRVSDFLLKFEEVGSKKKKMNKTLEEKTEDSKRFWFRAVGLVYKKVCGKKD